MIFFLGCIIFTAGKAAVYWKGVLTLNKQCPIALTCIYVSAIVQRMDRDNNGNISLFWLATRTPRRNNVTMTPTT